MKEVQISDAELIRSYAGGNEQAFSRLMARYEHKLYGYIMNRVKDPHLAQDIFQEVFIKVIDTIKFNRYNEKGRFGAWLMRIAHNMIIDHFRRQKRQKNQYDTEEFSVFDVLPDNSTAENQLVRLQTIDRVRKLIDELPPEQQRVLRMRIYENIPFKDIAEMCDISINTALGRMRYALINLRKLMKKYNLDLSD